MSIKFEKDEYIIYTARKHWFVLVGSLFGIVLLFFSPFLIILLVGKIIPGVNIPILIDGNIIFLGIALIATWTLALWIVAFVIWTNYFLDTLILTNKKLININQKSLFSREISSLRLEKIQDISIEINGVIATFLKFGNIHIQTAGEKNEFILPNAKNPLNIKEKILKQQKIIINI